MAPGEMWGKGDGELFDPMIATEWVGEVRFALVGEWGKPRQG
jgi:hypothetical protein